MLAPISNKISSHYVETCLKSSSSENSYAKCILKKGKHLQDKQEELSHKFIFIEMTFEKCKANNLNEGHCIAEAKKMAAKVVEDFVKDAQKY